MYIYSFMAKEAKLGRYFVIFCLTKELIEYPHWLNQSKDLTGVAIGIAVMINAIIAG